MFETAELGQTVGKEEYEREVETLRLRLLDVQTRLKEANFPVIVLISGVELAGKSETVQKLLEWLDPRFVETHGFRRATAAERAFPPFHRFWRRLPARGRIGVFFGNWYTEPLVARAYKEISDADLVAAMTQVNTFERELAAGGALVLKFWFHLSKKAQKKRIGKLLKDPDESYRVSDFEREYSKRYDAFLKVSERALSLTTTAEAPWVLVEGDDKRYRSLLVGRTLVERLEKALSAVASKRSSAKASAVVVETPPARETLGRLVLDGVDLSQRLDDDEYERELDELESRFGRLCRKLERQGKSAVLAFEGWDAAGKGGVIRRVVGAIDPRLYSVIPVAAPSDEEKAHHYLWRFWRHVPGPGRISLFDRTWYGRVLVERVEGFANRDEWSRAYAEINDFERQLTEHGIAVEKFWLHVDRDEQERRFRERENTAWKRFKITEEDWRNRSKWSEYEVAVHDMVEKTSTVEAPWNLVPCNDKKFGRVFVLRALCRRLERHLG
ncbi:MAG TPA: polyphosphate:AMP phosphotransferase [Polyangiaceae bacterium]|nr:polyphosphate:AMP phosphotransferase [Polyangiaceae bacterium]